MQRMLMLMFGSVLLLLQVKGTGDIVGRWEAMQTTRGGLGSTLQFNRDGSFTFSFGALGNGTYKLDGNKLIVTTFQSPPQKPTKEVHEIKIEGDTLFEKTEYGVDKSFRLGPGAQNNSPLVGKWVTKTPTYEFRRDGSFNIDSSDNITDNGKYKLVGNQLYLTTPSPGAKESVTKAYEIAVIGDTLLWKQDDPPTTIMRRISPANAEGPAIVGLWSLLRPDGTDNISITEYKANGEWTFRLPIITYKGQYSIKGDLLTTTFDDKGIKISRFSFESGHLVLQSPPEQGSVDKFKRIE